VAGIGSNSKRMLNGAWTLEWLGAEEARQPSGTKTLLEALKNAMPETKFDWIDSVGFESGANVNTSRMAAWREKANSSDALILAVGEQPYSEFKGNTNDLNLSPAQQYLLNQASASGKPVVLILMEGRPRILPEMQNAKQAILFAGHPGTAGGEALAQILSGKYNPSGKLCFTYPKTVGHAIPYYHKKSEKYDPAFPFGHGLHFGQVEYKSLKPVDTLVGLSHELNLKVRVRNSSLLPVEEAVLVFNHDETGRITRPVRKLVAFRKINLKAGEEREVEFQIPAKELCSFPDETGLTIQEPGFHGLQVGDQKCRIRIY
jgi:beta-glucosidase